MDAEKWNNLPWWAQRTYIEGFMEEGLLELTEGSPIDIPSRASRVSEGPEEAPFKKHNPDKPKRVPTLPGVDPVIASTQQLRALGLTVIDGGRV